MPCNNSEQDLPTRKPGGHSNLRYHLDHSGEFTHLRWLHRQKVPCSEVQEDPQGLLGGHSLHCLRHRPLQALSATHRLLL